MGLDCAGNADTYLPEFWAHLRAAKRESLLAAFSYHTYGDGHMAATNGGTGWEGLRNSTVLDDWYLLLLLLQQILSVCVCLVLDHFVCFG
jgi:hypothetical protein